MYYIQHIGYGPLVELIGDSPLTDLDGVITFPSYDEAYSYLAAAGEERYLGIDWEIRTLP